MTRASRSQRLLSKLRANGVDLPPGTVLRTIRASRAQRTEGAWSWSAVTPDGHTPAGSQWTMLQCLIAPSLTFQTIRGDIHIDPEPLPGTRRPQ